MELSESNPPRCCQETSAAEACFILTANRGWAATVSGVERWSRHMLASPTPNRQEAARPPERPSLRQRRGRIIHHTNTVVCVCVCTLSCVQLFETPWTLAHQAPHPRDFPGKNTGVSCHSLLQGIFLSQESNSRLLCLLH